MDFFKNLFYIINTTLIEIPQMYGAFHILSFLAVILVALLISSIFKDCSDRALRRITFVFWLLIFVMEIIKQLRITFDYDPVTDSFSGRYRWYVFPYEICSQPLYVLPLIVLLKDGKIRDGMIAYMAFFSFFAGCSIIIYPKYVFVETLYNNVQTMVHHGTQVVLGSFYLVRYRKKLSIRFFVKSLIVLIPSALIAVSINEIVPTFTTEEINMWNISRHFRSKIKPLNMVFDALPYPLFVVVYVLAFIIVAFVTYLIAKKIYDSVNTDWEEDIYYARTQK